MDQKKRFPRGSIWMLLAASATAALAGCAEIKFPAAAAGRLSDGTIRVMTGSLIGRVNGTSNFDVASKDGVTCIGQTQADGTGSVACTDGASGTFTFPKQAAGKFSGYNVSVLGGRPFAFGWGKSADTEFLSGLLP
jgi:hypothetical protein